MPKHNDHHIICIAASTDVDAMKLMNAITAFGGVAVLSVEAAGDVMRERSPSRPANATPAPAAARKTARKTKKTRIVATGKTLAETVYDMFAKHPDHVFSSNEIKRAIKPLGFKSNGSTAVYNTLKIYPGQIERTTQGHYRYNSLAENDTQTR